MSSKRFYNRKCKYCGQIKKCPSPIICTECTMKHTAAKTKFCTTCESFKDWQHFGTYPRKLFDLKSKCKMCDSVYADKRFQKREKFLRNVLNSCRGNNNRRRENGRRDLKFTWTYKQMVEKLEQQKDRCSYSDLLMNFRPHCDWKCSPERIDNQLGYVDSNIIFICQEFQLGHSLQASREMVDFLCTVETRPHPRLEEIMSGEFKEENLNFHCKLGKHKCKQCQKIWNNHYPNTVRGRMAVLAAHSRTHTKYRNTKGRNHGPSESDFKHNLEMLQIQAGKCHLTGHHLSFQGGVFNCVSLERKETTLGYTKGGNMSLIMQCLNTSNFSVISSLANKDQPREGHGGWTKEKITFLRDSRATIENVIDKESSLDGLMDPKSICEVGEICKI